MKVIAMIPARYAASRFPGKLMAKLGSKSVILRTYEAVVKTNLFDDVFVVADSDIIRQEIERHGGKVIMSKKEHETGSDRIAEAVADLDVDIIVNVQGDEPFTAKEPLVKLIDVFKEDKKEEVDLASLMQVMTKIDQIENPNVVKVVVDHNNFAMYFSRSPIPYPRDREAGGKYYEHIGVYAFRKRALDDFSRLEMRANEATEKIEAIRFLEYGRKIKMIESEYLGIGINTPEDLEAAHVFLGEE